MQRNDLSLPIRDIDIVVMVGVGGTLRQACHILDGKSPVLGVNSDPTQVKEVIYFDHNNLDIISVSTSSYIYAPEFFV